MLCGLLPDPVYYMKWFKTPDWTNSSRRSLTLKHSFVLYVEPSGVQALKNPNPLKDNEGWLCLLLLSCPLDRIWGRFNM